MSKHKLLLVFLALPFFAFAFMVGQGLVAASAPRFALPVQGFDPRDLLYGRYVNLRIHDAILVNTKQIGCSCILPSSSVEKVGYQNAISYLSCDVAKQNKCIAIIDGRNEKHMKALSAPVRIYIEESMGPELDTILRKEPQRLELQTSLAGNEFKFHGLLLDGKPVKSIYAPDPFNMNNLVR